MEYKDTRVLGHLYAGFGVGSTDESRMHEARDVRKRGHSSCNCLGIGLPSGEDTRCYFILQTSKQNETGYAMGAKQKQKGRKKGNTEMKTREHTKKNELHLSKQNSHSHYIYFNPRGASRGEVSSITK